MARGSVPTITAPCVEGTLSSAHVDNNGNPITTPREVAPNLSHCRPAGLGAFPTQKKTEAIPAATIALPNPHKSWTEIDNGHASHWQGETEPHYAKHPKDQTHRRCCGNTQNGSSLSTGSVVIGDFLKAIKWIPKNDASDRLMAHGWEDKL